MVSETMRHNRPELPRSPARADWSHSHGQHTPGMATGKGVLSPQIRTSSESSITRTQVPFVSREFLLEDLLEDLVEDFPQGVVIAAGYEACEEGVEIVEGLCGETGGETSRRLA